MRAYYEAERESSWLVVSKYDDYQGFPSHYHDNAEIFIVESGEVEVTVNQKKYLLKAGDFSVADSYDEHSYSCDGKVKATVVIVPYRYLNRFNYYKKGLEIVEHVVSNEQTARRLLLIADEFLSNPKSEWQGLTAANLFLSELFEHLQLGKRKDKSDYVLLKRTLQYIHNNFQKDISLVSIAKELGYTSDYVSVVFHRHVDTPLPQYVNELRYQQVQILRSFGGKSMAECIFEAGFQSQQTYYRYAKKKSK